MVLRWRGAVVAMAVVVGGLTLLPSPASACSCGGLQAGIPPDVAAVFVGTAVDEHDSDLGPDLTEVLYEVDEVFVGRVHEREPVLVRTGDGSMCGTHARLGVSQGVAAVRHPDGFLDLNLCSMVDPDQVRAVFTDPSVDAATAAQLAAYRDAATLVPGQGPEISLKSTWGRRKIGLVGMAVVLVVALGFLAYRRRFESEDLSA
jgi:hypothetical protein